MPKLRNLLSLLLLAGMLLFGTGAAPAMAGAGSGPNPAVIMETSMGRIVVMLYPETAPITVMNFLRYVDAGFYDGTVFHRIVKMEVNPALAGTQRQQAINIVQGGGYVYPLQRKRPLWGPIPNEGGVGLLNKRGTLAMARGAAPDSAQCEFFFNVKDNAGLDSITVNRSDWEVAADPEGKKRTVKTIRSGYCAFGKVIRGMDVVDKMLDVKTERMGDHKNVPDKPIFIKKVYRAR